MIKKLINPIKKKIGRNIAEVNIIKDIRNLFRLKNEKDSSIKDKAIRDVRNIFSSKRKGNVISDKALDKTIRDKRILLESDKQDYYEPIRNW